MPSVSAIILTRDSQRTIEACIQAIKPAVDHVIVVDTGSTDDTVQIAKSNGAYIYRFEWCDDFAAARNFGDSLATSDWVIHVDSDEIIRSEDVDKIRKLCTQYKKTNHPLVIGIQQINVLTEQTKVDVASRLYKRGTVMWKGIIHEYLVGKREPWKFLQSDVGVLHDGYHADIIDVRKKSMSRNIPLLLKGIEQEPTNAMYRYNLGSEYTFVEDYTSAIPHLRFAIELLEQQDIVNLIERAHNILLQCLHRSDNYDEAKQLADQMVTKFPGKYAKGWYGHTSV